MLVIYQEAVLIIQKGLNFPRPTLNIKETTARLIGDTIIVLIQEIDGIVVVAMMALVTRAIVLKFVIQAFLARQTLMDMNI